MLPQYCFITVGSMQDRPKISIECGSKYGPFFFKDIRRYFFHRPSLIYTPLTNCDEISLSLVTSLTNSEPVIKYQIVSN